MCKKNVANFSVWPHFELWSLISRAEFYPIPLKLKSRLPVHWSIISCDKNVIHVVRVNKMPNPKMKSFNSYVFVHEARHKKTHFLHKNRLLLYEQLWWNLGPSLTINIIENWFVNLFWPTLQILEWSYTSLSIGWFLVIWAISDHCHLISTSC